MKIPTLIAAIASLSLSSGLLASSVSNDTPQSWLAHYSESNSHGDVPAAVHALSRSGYFAGKGQPATAIGFFATVFAQNPTKVESWLASCRDLPASQYRVLVAAAWQSGSPEGARALLRESSQVSGDLRSDLFQLVDRAPTPIAQIPVVSESSLNLQWGAYLADGDQQHILNVLAAFGRSQPGLNNAVRYSLAQNAAADPRVMQICRDQLDKQPESVRKGMRAALDSAATTKI